MSQIALSRNACWERKEILQEASLLKLALHFPEWFSSVLHIIFKSHYAFQELTICLPCYQCHYDLFLTIRTTEWLHHITKIKKILNFFHICVICLTPPCPSRFSWNATFPSPCPFSTKINFLFCKLPQNILSSYKNRLCHQNPESKFQRFHVLRNLLNSYVVSSPID